MNEQVRSGTSLVGNPGSAKSLIRTCNKSATFDYRMIRARCRRWTGSINNGMTERERANVIVAHRHNTQHTLDAPRSTENADAETANAQMPPCTQFPGVDSRARSFLCVLESLCAGCERVYVCEYICMYVHHCEPLSKSISHVSSGCAFVRHQGPLSG